MAPVSDKLHGVEIVDNYRWLEGDNSNPDRMGEVTPEVGAWQSDEQNAYTRAVLDKLPGRKALEEQLRPLMKSDRFPHRLSVVAPLLLSRREGAQNQPNYFWREGSTGDSKLLLLDPAQLDPSGLTTITWIRPRQDGSSSPTAPTRRATRTRRLT